jgi:electron transfer flavoprotein beta subunit
MRLLVCVKQVPDPDAVRELDESSGGLSLPDSADRRISRYDEFAVEAAVRIKEEFAGTRVDVATVGAERAADALRRAMGMGADHGIHVQTQSGSELPAPAVARSLANVARRRDYTLILCGVMSEDMMQAQVGPMIAADLDWPCATAVMAATVSPARERVEVEREIEGGARELAVIGFPAVLTIQSGINGPRYPTLSNLLRANRQALEIIAPEPAARSYCGSTSGRLAYPRKSRTGLMLAGSRIENAGRLVEILRARALLRG